MKSFQEHEGTLEHTTFTPLFSHLPLDAHWNEWSVEYETISNLISVLEALKNLCHWTCRGDPYCPSAATTPPGSEGIVVSRNTLTAQHEKARVWGVRAGHVTVGLGAVYLDPINSPGKDTSQGRLEWWTQSALIPDMAWRAGKQGKVKKGKNKKNLLA